ncbi:hypothetical protein Tco_1302037 [Tanacetum coccineum]
MHLVNNNIGDRFDFPSMTKLFKERHNIFISWKCIKVLTMNSKADLKDVSEDFQIEVEFLLLVHSEPIGIFILVDSIPELVHVHFRNISSDEKCGIARSESKSIHDNLKCRLSLFLSKIKSSVAFSNLKPFLFGDKFQIKFVLLSSDGRYDSAMISHIQFIYKPIFSLKDNLDHEERL